MINLYLGLFLGIGLSFSTHLYFKWKHSTYGGNINFMAADSDIPAIQIKPNGDIFVHGMLAGNNELIFETLIKNFVANGASGKTK